MKILLAIDGSKFTKKMLACLTRHPELFGQTGAGTLPGSDAADPLTAGPSHLPPSCSRFNAEKNQG
jgi:hypothetical protein